MPQKLDIFLDSGAYSASTRGEEIDLDEYIEFIKKYKEYFSVIASLDVISRKDEKGREIGGKLSLDNWRYMKKKGLDPMPIFHMHSYDDYVYLEEYMKESDMIAVGAIAKITVKLATANLDYIWKNYFTDSEGYPIIKVHGFGRTSFDLWDRYPWYSVDSTTWILQGGANAHVWIAVDDGKGGFDFSKVPHAIDIGRSQLSATHFVKYSKAEQKRFLEYFDFLGYPLGKSEFRQESSDYRLKKGEMWADKETYLVEKVIEKGLCNNSEMRIKANLDFFLNKLKIKTENLRLKDTVRTRRSLWEKPIAPNRKRLKIDQVKVYMAGAQSTIATKILNEYDYPLRLMSYYFLKDCKEERLLKVLKGERGV